MPPLIVGFLWLVPCNAPVGRATHPLDVQRIAEPACLLHDSFTCVKRLIHACGIKAPNVYGLGVRVYGVGFQGFRVLGFWAYESIQMHVPIHMNESL